VDWSLIVSIVGIVLTMIFGGLLFYQSIERREQQRALRAYGHAMYNALWRMGATAEEMLKSNDLGEARRFATGINELSRSARNLVISFSREYGRSVPYREDAWQPEPLPQRSAWLPWRRRGDA